jgi:hypothetical protein
MLSKKELEAAMQATHFCGWFDYDAVSDNPIHTKQEMLDFG